jgi:hypothetical protein
VAAIPNLFHWFRRYVVVDLARIKKEITEVKATKAERDFFLLCFASIIRAASNADSVPVSGLEVTSQMKEREKEGRVSTPSRCTPARCAERCKRWRTTSGPSPTE